MNDAISMWSGLTDVLAAAELRDAVDLHHVRADALDRRAHLVQHPRQVLHVRLAGGVADHGRARGRGRGHQRVLGAHHGRLVHEEVARRQTAVGSLDHDVLTMLDLRAERAEGVEVWVQPAAADHVAVRGAAWWRRRTAPAAGRRPGTRRGCARPGPRRRRSSARSPRSSRPCWGSGGRCGTPRSSSSSSSASVSRMCGTLCSVTSASVSSAQASSGSAAFLLPAGTTVPDSGTPPSMTNFSMGAAARLPSPCHCP